MKNTWKQRTLREKDSDRRSSIKLVNFTIPCWSGIGVVCTLTLSDKQQVDLYETIPRSVFSKTTYCAEFRKVEYTVHRAYGGCGNTIRFSRGYTSNPMHTRHCNLKLTPLPILFYDTVLQYLYLVPVLDIEHFCWLVGLGSKIFEITLKFSNPRGCMLKIGENS